MDPRCPSPCGYENCLTLLRHREHWWNVLCCLAARGDIFARPFWTVCLYQYCLGYENFRTCSFLQSRNPQKLKFFFLTLSLTLPVPTLLQSALSGLYFGRSTWFIVVSVGEFCETRFVLRKTQKSCFTGRLAWGVATRNLVGSNFIAWRS